MNTEHCNTRCPITTEFVENIGVITANVQSISQRLEAIDKAVFKGNGEPGLLSRVTAIESKSAQSAESKRGRWSALAVIASYLGLALTLFYHMHNTAQAMARMAK